MREGLVKQFNDIGLRLKLLSKPMGGRRANKDIFQMDIKRRVQGTRRKEWFEIYPGHETNIIQVLDVDTKLNQVLLLVKEEARFFEREESKSWNPKRVETRRDELKRSGNYIRETPRRFVVRERSSGGNRHFLMGVDERQLFVAQLKSGVINIDEARKQLGNTVIFHEGARKMTPSRQGEWFFVRATEEQEKVIELLLTKKRAFILNKANIGRYAGRPRGNPHTADELIVIPANEKIIVEAQSSQWARDNKDLSRVKPIYPIRVREVFVRGCVRHIDHKTVKYSHWHQVILNNEGETAKATQSWID